MRGEEEKAREVAMTRAREAEEVARVASIEAEAASRVESLRVMVARVEAQMAGRVREAEEATRVATARVREAEEAARVANYQRKKCIQPQCKNVSRGKGVCVRHGHILKKCNTDGCNNRAQRKGYCKTHGGGRIYLVDGYSLAIFKGLKCNYH